MNKKTIALGTDDFKKVIEGNHYLVDKSLFIKEAVEDGASVVLMPRPRRWGKTLNISMLKYFFEKTESSNRHLFNGLAIEKHPDIMEHQGKYPVIFLTLKDAKQSTWDLCYAHIQEIVAMAYQKYEYLLTHETLNQKEKEIFQLIIQKEASQQALQSSLYKLCIYLHQYHGIEPIVLIDEYDAPIIAGFENDYYKEVVSFMQTFLGAALKGNSSLKKGFMTGILRVAKESIFSNLNNLSVCTLLSSQYSEHFGFTENEVKTMLAYYGSHENDEQIKLWYNNYQVGQQQSMYNPWSILSYVKNNRELLPYWMNSANNNLIKMIVQKNSALFKKDIEQLMLRKTIDQERNELVTFDSIFTDQSVAFNFLLFTGYLSFNKAYLSTQDIPMLSLTIPNKEVQNCYKKIITQWIEETVQLTNYQGMLQDLTSGDVESFKDVFERTVERVLSSLDVADDEPEKFYHMFVVGMLICLQETHQILSNRDSGTGRYDVMIIPRDITKIGVIIEFKRAKTSETLEAAIKTGLTQIKEKNYKAELEARGITQIICVAIAFSGKKVLVQSDKITALVGHSLSDDR